MSFQPSRTETIKTLFHGNRFVIPPYQRKYSWQYDQQQALWDDIAENLDLKHFIGTLCFKKKVEESDIVNDVYEIIDGQQRITTLYLLVNSLIESLKDDALRSSYEQLFIGSTSIPKVIPLGSDQDFMTTLVNDFDSIELDELKHRSQINLYKAKRTFKGLIHEFSQADVKAWLDYVSSKIEILIFNVDDQAQAVKMFSVINDRGLPLNNLDKTKSILMLYSTLYLDASLNDQINDTFGNIFDELDETLRLKQNLQLFRTLDDKEFENTFYTHHYYSARSLFDDWDYQLGADSIFKQLKRHCEQIKLEPETLSEFIVDYIKDFNSFATSYRTLFERIQTDDLYSKLFQKLEFTATIYPLIVRLNELEILDDCLEALEIAEVRVYKLKNTNPRRNMYLLSSDVIDHEYDADRVNELLYEFVTNFLNDYRFEEYLNEGIDNKTALVRYILHEFNSGNHGQTLSLDDYRNLQVEHIFSKNPNFGIRHYGFGRHETYDVEIATMGNLTILEKGLNSKVSNIAPIDKMNGYEQSKIKMNAELLGKLKTLDREKMNERKAKMIEFCLNRFPIG